METSFPWTLGSSTPKLQAYSELRPVWNIFDQDRTGREENAKGLTFCSDNLHHRDIVNRLWNQQDAKDSRCNFPVSSNGALSALPIRSSSFAHLKHNLAEPHAQPAGGL